MNRLITKVTVVVAASACAAALATGIVTASAGVGSHSSAATTTTTLGPPIQGWGQHKLFFYVDTITGGGSPAPPAGCAMTNIFKPGQVVVFRMFGIHTPTGGTDLTPKTVTSAFVKIPGEARIPLVYGTHGVDSYYTAAWTIAKKYALGVVNFRVTVTTKAVPKTKTSPAIPAQTGTFSQAGMPEPSQLQVVKA
ncbi:MAG: hypothetical protein ACLQK4_04770 [Acidimicrobiales bacterium]|jgi:hypothetical protein